MMETLTHWQAWRDGLAGAHSPRTHSLHSSATTGSKPHATLLWPPQAADTHVLHIHICTENTHTYKIMKSKRKKEEERKLRCGGANIWPQHMGSHGRWIYTGTSRTARSVQGGLVSSSPTTKRWNQNSHPGNFCYSSSRLTSWISQVEEILVMEDTIQTTDLPCPFLVKPHPET